MDYDKCDKPWYSCDADDLETEDAKLACKTLHGMVTSLENDQSGRIHDMFKLMSVYHNRDLTANSPFRAPLLRSKPISVMNVTKSIVDTLVAKHVANESKATFDVDDGDWDASMRAEKLDKFCFGEVYRLNLYELYEQAFRDAAIVGDGYVKFYARDNKVFAERVYCPEVRYDLAQCVSGPPREMYQIRYIARSQAMAYYNDHAEEIEELPTVEPPYPYPGVTRDIVRLVEAWHLPDSDDDDSGRYGFACNDVWLSYKTYKRRDFPFVRFTWTQNLQGGNSIGLCEDLLPLQSELDKLKRRHLQGLYLHGLPTVYQQQGSKMAPEEITNNAMQKYTYTGSKPEVIQTQCVAPELVAEIGNIVQQMYQLSGVNPMQAGTDMFSRVDSRPGIKEYAALTDEKHAMPSKSWDRGILAGTRNIISVAREIEAGGAKYATMGAARDFVGHIQFKDCDLDDERFRMKVENTNLLPTTPAGKILRIQDLAQAGAFQDDPKALWMLLSGAPDVDAVIGDKTAGEKLVQKQIWTMMNEGKYFGPDKHQDCQMALVKANNAIQKLILKSTGGQDKDKRLQTIYSLLDRYCQDCKDILTAATAVPPAMMPGAMPDAGASPAGPIPPGVGAPGSAGPAGPIAA